MKFTSAAFALALSGSAMAGGADAVNAVLKEIADDLKGFDSAIKGWSGGDISSLEAASKKIQDVTDSGAQKISAGDALSLVDAAGITSNVQGLQTQLDTTLGDLKAIGDKLASAGKCGAIQGQLKSQSSSAANLQDAITSKSPPEAKSIAQQLGGQIGASIKDTQAYFDKTCAGAPSGGSSSGGAPSGGASSSGSSSSGGASSSGSAPKSGGSSSGGSMPAGHNMGSSGSKPASATSAPKPATYTGAGSTVQVPFAVALALAVFAL